MIAPYKKQIDRNEQELTEEYRQRYAQRKVTFRSQNVSGSLGEMLEEAGLVDGMSYRVRDVRYVPNTEAKEPHLLFEVDVFGRNILLPGKFFGERP